jgi:uncharacterized protein YjfI (DUF2170 family)
MKKKLNTLNQNSFSNKIIKKKEQFVDLGIKVDEVQRKIRIETMVWIGEKILVWMMKLKFKNNWKIWKSQLINEGDHFEVVLLERKRKVKCDENIQLMRIQNREENPERIF